VLLSEGEKVPLLNEHAKGSMHLGPEFLLYDPLRKGEVYFGTGFGARLQLLNTPGHPGVILSTEQPPDSSRTRAWLALYDGNKVAADLITTIGVTGLDLWDEAGRLRAVIGNSDLNNPVLDKAPGLPMHRPESSLVLLGSHGKLLWKAP
jgi:hypothetical protein